MIAQLLLALALASDEPQHPDGCAPESPVRDPEICEPLYEEGNFTLYSIESVAVGSVAEMKEIRPKARECGLSNRIDYVGELDVAIFDIIDASRESRNCLLAWIEREIPHLKYSEERLSKRFREAPRREDANEAASE
ncbi:MAG: hypothetical protein QNJ15_10665 [Erythrobacter sp.]|nr:hypothetical protein [Erythrobacter sp.]